MSEYWMVTYHRQDGDNAQECMVAINEHPVDFAARLFSDGLGGIAIAWTLEISKAKFNAITAARASKGEVTE